MAYSDFTIPELKQKFGIVINETTNLFDNVNESAMPNTLTDTLRRYLPLSLNLNTEKARSELIIAPVLTELKLLYWDKISLFSGIEFNIDDAMGLRGHCDFILSQNPEQLVLTAPVCMLVEAKNENILAGIPQCLAEMIAALKFNQAQGIPPTPVFGIVTTGILWRFLKMHEKTAYVDIAQYTIHAPIKLFSILKCIVFNEC